MSKSFEGKNLEKVKHQPSKVIAKIIRESLKKEFPNCKFSVSKQDYSGGRNISVILVESTINPFAPVDMQECEKISFRRGFGTKEEIAKSWQNEIDEGRMNINYYYIQDNERLSEEGKKLMEGINDIIKSYNYDNSDIMTDYFDVNFYYSIAIGKWDKPFKHNCNGKHKTVNDIISCKPCGELLDSFEVDEPIEGKQYALTGGSGDKCIANGNTWKESLIN